VKSGINSDIFSHFFAVSPPPDNFSATYFHQNFPHIPATFFRHFLRTSQYKNRQKKEKGNQRKSCQPRGKAGGKVSRVYHLLHHLKIH
jgi:hypothetical protein